MEDTPEIDQLSSAFCVILIGNLMNHDGRVLANTMIIIIIIILIIEEGTLGRV